MASRQSQSVVRHFVGYGVHLALSTRDAETATQIASPQLDAMLPPGWRQDNRLEHCEPVVRYDVEVAPSHPAECKYTLSAGSEIVGSSHDLATVLRAFTTHAEFQIAQRAPDHLFVHAGVVAWRGSAILMPGPSFAGKTTLVRAFLEEGATYYSDEYAVLDGAGRVNPYPRHDGGRCELPSRTQLVPAETLGAQTGMEALPVHFVLVTTYRPGSQWRPRRLTQGQALLRLMANTVAAQGSPAHSMPILRQAVAHAKGLGGPRGDAIVVVKDFIRRVAEETDRIPVTSC